MSDWQKQFGFFFDRKINFSLRPCSAVACLITLLSFCFLVYPSFLLSANTSSLVRISLACVVAFLLVLLRKALLYLLVKDETQMLTASVEIPEILLPLGIGVLAFIFYLPFLFASPASSCDEMAHIRGAVFGQLKLFQLYRYQILGFAVFAHLLLCLKKTRIFLSRIFTGNAVVFFTLGLAFFVIFYFHTRPTPKAIYAIYRFPALGKFLSLYIYSWSGISTATFRLPAHIAHALLAVPVFFLARSLNNSRLLSFLLTAIVLLMPILGFFSHLMYLESIWLLLIMIAVFCLQKFFQSRKNYKSWLLFYCCGVQAAFLVRNTTLLLPVFILLASVFLFIILRHNAEPKKLLKLLCLTNLLALMPMFAWHALYMLHDHIAGKMRHYNFSLRGFTYLYGLEAYAKTIGLGVGVIFALLITLAALYALCKKITFSLVPFALLSLAGFTLFMLGDYGFKSFFGYGRFLYMPLVGALPLVFWFFGQFSTFRGRGVVALVLFLCLAEIFYKIPSSPSAAVGRYGCELFFSPEEQNKLLKSLRPGKSTNVAVVGYGEILMYNHDLLGKSRPLQLSLDNPITQEQVLSLCKKNKRKVLWECLEGGFIKMNADPAEQSYGVKPFNAIFDLEKLPRQIRLESVFKGPNKLEYRKYLLVGKSDKFKAFPK